MREIDVVFDGPPGPQPGRFVEVEDANTGEGVTAGRWIKRDDGYWALRLFIDDPNKEKRRNDGSDCR